MATYLLKYTDAQDVVIILEIEAYTDQHAYNQAASKLWSLGDACAKGPSLTRASDGCIIAPADEIWF